MKVFENRFSLAINLWVFLIFGSLLARGIGGYFSSYLDAPMILLISIIYTLITAIMTWQSTLKKKEADRNKYNWKIIAAQMISLLHFFGGIYIFLTMFLTSFKLFLLAINVASGVSTITKSLRPIVVISLC